MTSTNEITFDDAIQALTNAVDVEIDNLDENDLLTDDEKAVTRVMLTGYKRALSDLVMMIQPDDEVVDFEFDESGQE